VVRCRTNIFSEAQRFAQVQAVASGTAAKWTWYELRAVFYRGENHPRSLKIPIPGAVPTKTTPERDTAVERENVKKADLGKGHRRPSGTRNHSADRRTHMPNGLDGIWQESADREDE